MIDNILRDLRFGVRTLARTPGFTAVAIVTLALGVGANTAIFSVVNAVLLNPFPYTDADRIMQLNEYSRTPDNGMSVAYPNFLDWRKQQSVFDHLSAARNADLTLTGGGEPLQLKGAAVSASVFPMLGIEPLLGRVFRENEDRLGADRVAVLGYGLWTRRFGGAPDIVNRTIVLDDQSYTVVGVMPPRFQLWAAEIYVPIGLNFEGDFHDNRVARTGNSVLGKLKPGVTQGQAQVAMDVIARRLGQAYPDTNKDVGIRVDSLKDNVVSGIRPALLVLLGAVGLLLLIACANVANLLLTRTAAREREVAIRTALGAERWRMVRQLLVETVPLALAGGLSGLALAWAGIRALLALIPPDAIPIEARIQLDWTVLAFTLGLALCTTLVFGLLPALQATRRDATAQLKDSSWTMTSGRERQRARQALVVAEVALSLTLLVGAGLLINSFQRLQAAKPGFRPDNVLRLRVGLPVTKYSQRDRSETFFRQAVERIGALPGVRVAGAATSTPFSNYGSGLPVVTEGAHYQNIQDLPFTGYTLVMGDYFQTMGMTVMRGRTFNDRDSAEGVPVVIVNETFAKKFFPGKNGIGERVLLGLPDNLMKAGLLPEGLDHFEWLTVVGVVNDTKRFSLSQVQPEAYVPYQQGIAVLPLLNTMFVVARTADDPLKLAGAAREQVWALDANQPIAEITAMSTAVAEALRQPRFSTVLLSVFAFVALALAAIGVYSIMAYSVSQRTREVGIRMALGAERRDVLQSVLGQGMKLAGIGLALGLVGAFGISRVLASMLYEVSATDPLTFACVAAVLAGVALSACYVPARRATRIDPLLAIRSE